jgi:hypothetical protein
MNTVFSASEYKIFFSPFWWDRGTLGPALDKLMLYASGRVQVKHFDELKLLNPTQLIVTLNLTGRLNPYCRDLRSGTTWQAR